MTHANRTITQCPCRSGRGDVTSEPLSDAGVTAPSLGPDESDDGRPRSGDAVGSDAGTGGRSVAVAVSVGRR